MVNTSFDRQYRKLTFINPFTYSNGPLTATSNFPRATLANVLNPAPGTHSGTYFTGTSRWLSYLVFPRVSVGRTYWDYIDKESTWNHSPCRDVDRLCCGPQEPIFVICNVQTICNLHNDRCNRT